MRFIFIILIFTIGIVGFFSYRVPSIPVTKQDFIVSQGDSIYSLQKKLNINIGTLPYKGYIYMKQKGFILQAGTYHMDEPQSLDDLFSKTLSHPISKDITITILPGWNIFDIDTYLSSIGIIKTGDFIVKSENISSTLQEKFPFLKEMKTLEGMFLPDTYRIKPDASADDIIYTLLKEFNEKIYIPQSFSSFQEFYEILIFASIIEKEEKSTINKPIVAGILKKRYQEKIAIGADATVCYAYRLSMTDCTPMFINEHIYKRTPYNTRNSLNLPPTPIANPSTETFFATLNAESSPYYYYLHDNQGEIHYGKSLEEHNRNRVQFLGK